MKVVIIVPFFGRFPMWMEYFLGSCEANPSYQWMIFSDAPKPPGLPDNVRFEACSLSDFSQLAGSSLDLDINIRNPYKICDLRPAFGIIFSDYLKDADFWAYSDLDLVYGNFETFLIRDVFENYDVISSRKEYIAGHFALYRNIKRVNELYKLSPPHQKIFQDGSRHFAFDERSNIYGRKLFNPVKNPRYRKVSSESEYFWHKLKYKAGIGIPAEPADMNTILEKVEGAGEIRVFRKDLVRSDKWYREHGKMDWKVNFENGRLFDVNSAEEFLHFHFLEGKKQPGFKIDPVPSTGSFSISAEGIRAIPD